MGTKKKTVKKKGKKIRKGRKHESTKIYSFYILKGTELERKKTACPRCGAGTWLAKHKDRLSCGHCGYTIFESKNTSRDKEAKEQEKNQLYMKQKI